MKSKIQQLNYDYELVNNEIYGNYEFVIIETDDIYGSVENIIKYYEEPARTYILREREIYFKEALKFMFELSLLNAGSLTE